MEKLNVLWVQVTSVNKYGTVHVTAIGIGEQVIELLLFKSLDQHRGKRSEVLLLGERQA
jgi:hypothetical protein